MDGFVADFFMRIFPFFLYIACRISFLTFVTWENQPTLPNGCVEIRCELTSKAKVFSLCVREPRSSAAGRGQGSWRLLVDGSAEFERVKPWRLATFREMEADLERRIRDIRQPPFAPADPVSKRVAGNGSALFARESRKRLAGHGVDQLDFNPAAFCTG